MQMLGSCEKMSTAISATTNQWPQKNQRLDDQNSFMASNEATEKSGQDPHHQPLKCPRCDSSNTKFCYYNNYSLSQPRHFCKACKRYWTRGGTLRNVPVGGGCRRNKRVKRPQPPANGGGGISSVDSTTGIKPSVQPDVDLPPTSSHVNNPLFYSLPTNPLEVNFPFSRFSTTRVSSDVTGSDHQHQMNGFGIGFSSGFMTSDQLQNTDGSKQIQDVITTTSSFADNRPIFFGSSTFAPTSTMASLLASSLQQRRFGTIGLKDTQNDFPGLMPYEDIQIFPGGNGEIWKEADLERENRSERNPDQIEQLNSSHPSSLLWNTNNSGAWFDP